MKCQCCKSFFFATYLADRVSGAGDLLELLEELLVAAELVAASLARGAVLQVPPLAVAVLERSKIKLPMETVHITI